MSSRPIRPGAPVRPALAVRSATARALLAGVALGALPLAGCGIDNIPTYDEAADAAWAEVQNQYRRRADLAPDLVATVEGFADPEREALRDVVEAHRRVTRANVSPGTLGDPAAFEELRRDQDALGSALRRLVVTVEARSDPTSNRNFLALRDRLEDVENRIAFARGDYVEAVRRYNTELRTVPGRWWHRFMYAEMDPKQNFPVPGADAADPAVDFSDR